jgi:hypothetical protein
LYPFEVNTLREQNENKEVKPIDNHILRAEMRLSLNTPRKYQNLSKVYAKSASLVIVYLGYF